MFYGQQGIKQKLFLVMHTYTYIRVPKEKVNINEMNWTPNQYTCRVPWPVYKNIIKMSGTMSLVFREKI